MLLAAVFLYTFNFNGIYFTLRLVYGFCVPSYGELGCFNNFKCACKQSRSCMLAIPYCTSQCVITNVQKVRLQRVILTSEDTCGGAGRRVKGPAELIHASRDDD